MIIDPQVTDGLQDIGVKVAVVITCSGNVSKVQALLEQLHIEVTSAIPEFLIINALIDKAQLKVLSESAGIGSIEFDHAYSI